MISNVLSLKEPLAIRLAINDFDLGLNSLSQCIEDFYNPITEIIDHQYNLVLFSDDMRAHYVATSADS